MNSVAVYYTRYNSGSLQFYLLLCQELQLSEDCYPREFIETKSQELCALTVFCSYAH